AGCRGLSRQFRARPGGARTSRAETRVASRLHLIVRPGGRGLAPERTGGAVAVGVVAGGTAGRELAIRLALGGAACERDARGGAPGLARPGAAGGERARAGAGGPARLPRVGGLARDLRRSDDWSARGGRADLLPPGARARRGNHGGHR